jgi:hypothetical protein
MPGGRFPYPQGQRLAVVCGECVPTSADYFGRCNNIKINPLPSGSTSKGKKCEQNISSPDLCLGTFGMLLMAF